LLLPTHLLGTLLLRKRPEIFMGDKNTIVLHNTCEDLLLAAPIILDLVLLAELSTRIQLKPEGTDKFHSFHPVATILSYLTKAPL
ncbi:hypothetical protein ACJX0J_041598, partial [Zea mays]